MQEAKEKEIAMAEQAQVQPKVEAPKVEAPKEATPITQEPQAGEVLLQVKVALVEALSRERALQGKVDKFSSEASRLRTKNEELERSLKDSKAEERLKERDGLRGQVSTSMSRAAALERERDAAKAETDVARKELAASRQMTDRMRATVESMQVARNSAQLATEAAGHAAQDLQSKLTAQEGLVKDLGTQLATASRQRGMLIEAINAELSGSSVTKAALMERWRAQGLTDGLSGSVLSLAAKIVGARP